MGSRGPSLDFEERVNQSRRDDLESLGRTHNGQWAGKDRMAMLIDPQLTGGEVITLEGEENEADYDHTHLGYNPQLGGEAHSYDAQLAHDRRKQKERLQSRFEHIFEKYGKDFDGVGDEIDLETGLIVVDNGHLRKMQHEADAGDEDTLDPELRDEADVAEDEDAVQSTESDNDAEDEEDDEGSACEDVSMDEAPVRNEVPDNFFDMPSLRESVLDLQTKQRQGHGIDHNAIEALGMSIAKQLTDLMSQNDRPGSKRKTDDMWAYPDIPRPPPEKRVRRSLSPLPDWPGPSPGRKSLWAPQRVPKRRKKKQVEEAAAEQTAQAQDGSSIKPEDANIVPEDSLEHASLRVCYNCRSSDSVVWRKGPDGLMCNACGMYYYRYGLIRPIGPIEESDDSADESSELGLESESEAEADEVESQYSANTSRRRDELPQKGSPILHEEDVLILKLKEIDRLSWERIAKHLPARTAYAVQCRYSKKLHNRPVEARATLANQGYEYHYDDHGLIVFTPAATPQGFSDEEDELLLKLREEDRLGWDHVAAFFPNRAPKALELRFNQLVKKIMKEHRHPGRKEKPRDPASKLNVRYSEEEDELLRKLREDDQLTWTEVAQRFPGRNALALQKRYVREVSQAAKERQLRSQGALTKHGENLKHLRYTFEEDELLLQLREQQGLSWEKIEERMTGRLRDSIERRYQYMQVRKEHAKMLQSMAAARQNVQGSGQDSNADGAQSDDELQQDDVEESFSMLTYTEPSLQTNAPCTAADAATARGRAGSQPLIPGHTAMQTHTCNDTTASRAHSAPPLERDAPDVSRPRRSPPKKKLIVRWSKEEDELLQKLRADGLDWDAIALQFPGRKRKAIQGHYSVKFGNAAQHRQLPENQQKEPSLLRRAIDNSARRRSLEHSTNNASNFIDLTGDDDEVVPVQPVRTGNPAPPIERSAMAKASLPRLDQAEQTTTVAFGSQQGRHGGSTQHCGPMQMSKAHLMSASMRPPSTLDGPPKVPAIFREPSLQIMSPSGVPHDRQPFQTAPSTHTARSLPLGDLPLANCVASPTPWNIFGSQLELAAISPELPAVDNTVPTTSHETQTSRPTTRDGEYQMPVYPQTPFMSARPSPQPLEHSSALRSVNYFTPVRHSAQAHPYFVAPPAPMYIPTQHDRAADDHGSANEHESSVDGTDDEIVVHKQAAPNPGTSKGKLRPVAKRQQRTRHSTRRAASSTTLNRDARRTVATFHDQEDIDAESGEEHERDGTHAKGANSKRVADVAATYDLPLSSEAAEANHASSTAPPPYDWIELAVMALESTDPMPMTTETIKAYLIDTYPYFSQDPHGNWMSYIRSTLLRRKEFTSVEERSGMMWALTGVPYIKHERKLARPVGRLGAVSKGAAASTNAQEFEISSATRSAARDDGSSKMMQKSQVMELDSDAEINLSVVDSAKEYDPHDFAIMIEDDTEPDSDVDEPHAHKTSEPPATPTRIADTNGKSELNDSAIMLVDDSEVDREAHPEKPVHEEDEDAELYDSAIVLDDGDEAHSASKAPIVEDEDEDELSAAMTSMLASSVRSSRHSMLVKSSSKAPASEPQDHSVLPVCSAQLTSDIARDPESTPGRPITRSHRGKPNDLPSDSSQDTPGMAHGAFSSSSPILNTKFTAKVYSRASTPGTERSTLFNRPNHGRVDALRSSFGRYTPSHRSSSVGLPGSRKRVVQTTMRDGDDSEDELA